MGVFKVFSLLSVLFFASLSEATIDDLCSDVSFWDVVEYKSRDSNCCEVKAERKCEKKNKEVCLDAPEMKCKTIAWADCNINVWTNNNGKKCEPQYKDFEYITCQEEKYSVAHKKKVPVCVEVTKDNCVTAWDVDESGNKEWAGSEDCTPVTWEECNIEEKEVDFPAVKTNCKPASPIKWVDYVQQNDASVDECENRCEVRSAVHCEPVISTKCANVEYTDCKIQRSAEKCTPRVVHKPFQEKRHQKKCLT